MVLVYISIFIIIIPIISDNIIGNSDLNLHTKLIIFKLKLENIKLKFRNIKNRLNKIFVAISKSQIINIKGEKLL